MAGKSISFTNNVPVMMSVQAGSIRESASQLGTTAPITFH